MIPILIEILVSLFDSVLRIYFITKFNKLTIRNNKFFLPAILLIFITTLIGDHISPGFNTVISILLLIITIAYAVLISQSHYVNAIFSACIWTILYILLSSLLHQLLSMTITDFANTLHGSTSIPRYILIILHKVFLLAIIKFILATTKSDRSIALKNGVLTLLVSLVTLLGMGTAMKVMVADSSSENPMLVITVTYVVINMLMYFLIYQIQKLQKDKYEVEFLNQKLSYEAKRYNDASIIWNEIRKAQHDFKQHLTILKCQIEDNNIDKCKEYIEKLLPNIYSSSKLIKSDNSIIDYMINSKLSPLKDTEVIISGAVSDISDITDTDLACLIGNILDNAVEAINNVDDKKIELTFHNQNSNRLIICKNTISQSVLTNNKALRSTKNNTMQHGYGHLIIEKIVYKYKGLVDYFEEDNMFGIQVLLPEPEPKETEKQSQDNL